MHQQKCSNFAPEYIYIIINMKLYIKEILSKKGLTQKNLAEMLGLNYAAFNNTLNGNPTVGTLQKIADALDVPFEALFVKPEKDDFLAIIVKNGEVTSYKSAEELKKVL